MKLELPTSRPLSMRVKDVRTTSLSSSGSGSRACLLIPRTGVRVWFKKWDSLDLNPAWLGPVMVNSYLLDLYGEK
jgi:hypothetical protein